MTHEVGTGALATPQRTSSYRSALASLDDDSPPTPHRDVQRAAVGTADTEDHCVYNGTGDIKTRTAVPRGRAA